LPRRWLRHRMSHRVKRKPALVPLSCPDAVMEETPQRPNNENLRQVFVGSLLPWFRLACSLEAFRSRWLRKQPCTSTSLPRLLLLAANSLPRALVTPRPHHSFVNSPLPLHLDSHRDLTPPPTLQIVPAAGCCLFCATWRNARQYCSALSIVVPNAKRQLT